jgi:hypothetical protein
MLQRGMVDGMRRITKHTRTGSLARGVGLATTLGAAQLACAAEAAGLTELSVVAGAGSADHEYRFELPAHVPSGATRVSLDNEGDEAHHAQLLRLDDGENADDLAAALAEGGPPAALDVGAFVGGTGLVAPGEVSRADAVVDLAPGNYVFLCFVDGPDGRPHVAHGMLRPFTVHRAEEENPLPEADAVVELVDYAFDVPETIEGDAVLEVRNEGRAEPHEMVIARLEGAATADDVSAAMERGEPVPATPVGGVQALLPGARQHVQLDLDDGRYVVICAVPAPDGEAHHSKGMIAEVTVT